MKILSALQGARQRSTVITLCMILSFLECKNQSVDNDLINAVACEECLLTSTAGMAVDCFVLSFLENDSIYSKCSNVYRIKGVVLDKYEYGLNIKLVEDLKGSPKPADSL